MAEEEQGYTFVDKRRSSSEEAAPVPPEVLPEPVERAAEDPAALPDALEDEASDTGEVPDVYSLLGYCISLLSTEAWRALGLIANPQTGEAKADLVQAKVAIDAVGDLAARLETAPAEVLPPNFRREMLTLLNDLRLNYVAQRDAAHS